MKKKRVNHALIPTTFIEGLLCLYFLFGIGLGFQLHDFGLMGFHLMFFLGFGYVFWLSLKSERGGY